MIGEVQLHDVAAELRELRALGPDLDAVGDERRARRRIAAAAFDLDEAQAARAERLQRVGRAQLRHWLTDRRGRTHDRRAVGHRDRLPSISSVTSLDVVDGRRAEVVIVCGIHVLW